MRRWRDAARGSMRVVSERPDMWLPGALAWVSSIGWIPFVVAVVRPPTVAELTFLGAGIVSSGSWPWNAVIIGGAAVGLVILAFALVATANAVLIGLIERRATSGGDIGRIFVVSLVAALPAALAVMVVSVAAVTIAQRAFNAPDPSGGPVMRMVTGLAPYLALLGLTIAAGAAFAAVAGRLAVRRGNGVLRALRSAPAIAVRAASASHAMVVLAAQLVFLCFSTLLLGVLWAPIGAQLTSGGGFDIVIGLLLVGFVAIWLCLVLAGGALHAWSAAAWSRLLAADALEENVEPAWKP